MATGRTGNSVRLTPTPTHGEPDMEMAEPMTACPTCGFPAFRVGAQDGVDVYVCENKECPTPLIRIPIGAPRKTGTQ
jgi:hypothetical protein